MKAEGVAEIEGCEHPMLPGVSFYLAPHQRHKFVNTGKAELKFFWVFLPGGLSGFFRTIGRPRNPDEPAPDPFERPENIIRIEKDTVFGVLGS